MTVNINNSCSYILIITIVLFFTLASPFFLILCKIAIAIASRYMIQIYCEIVDSPIASW